MVDKSNTFEELLALLEAPAQHDDPRRCEVLVIDDDQEIRAALEVFLSNQYAVTTAGSGDEGVRRLSSQSHAVVLDIKMKGLDGFATFVELRRRSPDVPIIFFSAYQDLKDPLQILNEYRPFGYVLKDGNPQTLADTLASAVAHYRQNQHNKQLVEELRELNSTLEERVKQRTLELEAALVQLKQLTETDSLTGIANRRHFFQVYEGLLNDSSAPPEHVSLALIDVDHFKRINDRYGHPCGDVVLRTVAPLLKSNVRSEDLVARIGGEEFAVLMPGIDSEAAKAAAERLRRAVAGHEFPLEGGRILKVTISAGICAADGVTPDPEEFYTLADRALYAAKEHGRDTVESRTYGPMSERYPTSSG